MKEVGRSWSFSWVLPLGQLGVAKESEVSTPVNSAGWVLKKDERNPVLTRLALNPCVCLLYVTPLEAMVVSVAYAVTVEVTVSVLVTDVVVVVESVTMVVLFAVLLDSSPGTRLVMLRIAYAVSVGVITWVE